MMDEEEIMLMDRVDLPSRSYARLERYIYRTLEDRKDMGNLRPVNFEITAEQMGLSEYEYDDLLYMGKIMTLRLNRVGRCRCLNLGVSGETFIIQASLR